MNNSIIIDLSNLNCCITNANLFCFFLNSQILCDSFINYIKWKLHYMNRKIKYGIRLIKIKPVFVICDSE